jgi:hypothetical protein
MRRLTNSTLLSCCAIAVATLTGCPGPIVKEPETKYVTVEKFVPLPDKYVTIPQITYPKERTPFEAVRALNFNTPQLEQCIFNMQKIIELQPQK